MSILFDVDPYGDVEIPQVDLEKIIGICSHIISEDLILDYDDYEEGIEMLNDLIRISYEAIANNKGLVSIGD